MTPAIREPGGILLVSCYELGHPPHGLAMTAGFLEQAGFDPACVDLQQERLSIERLERAALVAISVPMHTALRMGVAMTRRVRAARPDCHIALFGLYAPLNEQHLRDAGADTVLGGECEPELVELARELAGTGPAAARAAAPLRRMAFPIPSRRRLPLISHYAKLIDPLGNARAAGYTETSRGCLDTCRHCPVPALYGGRFFVIDRDSVLEDIARQVDAGARHITFGDPDFLNGPGHSMAIVRELSRRHPGVSFDITAQVIHLLRDRDHLGELVELGCAFAVTAAESIEDQVLAALAKRHRRADLELALDLCDRNGLAVRPTFLPFTPWSTLEGFCELCEFIAARDLIDAVSPVQLSVRLLVPPGSLLLARPELRARFGPLDPEALSHSWTHPDPRMDELQRAIARQVESAARTGEPSEQTFAAIRGLAYAALAQEPPEAAPRPRRRVPRLSEPWFC